MKQCVASHVTFLQTTSRLMIILQSGQKDYFGRIIVFVKILIRPTTSTDTDLVISHTRSTDLVISDTSSTELLISDQAVLSL